MKIHRHETARAMNWRSARGQAQVEFALVIVMLMILCLGSVEVISLIHAYNVLADAAKEGVRYAIVHGDNNSTPAGPVCPCTDIDGPAAPVGTLGGNGTGYGVVKTYARYALHDITGLTVTTTYPDASRKPPNRVRVVVAYPFRPFFNLGWPTVTLNAAAEGRIMN
jgi:Flp pilus assembly protein TadG